MDSSKSKTILQTPQQDSDISLPKEVENIFSFFEKESMRFFGEEYIKPGDLFKTNMLQYTNTGPTYMFIAFEGHKINFVSRNSMIPHWSCHFLIKVFNVFEEKIKYLVLFAPDVFVSDLDKSIIIDIKGNKETTWQEYISSGCSSSDKKRSFFEDLKLKYIKIGE